MIKIKPRPPPGVSLTWENLTVGWNRKQSEHNRKFQKTIKGERDLTRDDKEAIRKYRELHDGNHNNGARDNDRRQAS